MVKTFGLEVKARLAAPPVGGIPEFLALKAQSKLKCERRTNPGLPVPGG